MSSLSSPRARAARLDRPFALRRWAAGLLAVAALAGCGGGTSQRDPFVAERYFAFGDEASALTAAGRKYSVNVLDNGSLSCRSDPLWVQEVARLYGFTFVECNPDGVTDFKARTLAAAGATVASLAGQIDTVIAGGGFGSKALASVLIGANDVWDLYAQYPTRTQAELLDEARQRGRAIGAQINRLAALDVRVLATTTPDQGLTPRALAEKAAFTDFDRAAFISDLTSAMNAGMRIEMLNDGRFVGLVLADEMVQAMAKVPSAFGLGNITTAVCTVALPACDTGTLVSGGASAQWLWADDRQMAYGGQNRLAFLAIARAQNNPF